MNPRRLFALLLALSFAQPLAALAESRDTPPESPPEDLAPVIQFEQEQGLRAWPGISGCHLNEADFAAGPVGLVLQVGEANGWGPGRRAGSLASGYHCHAFQAKVTLVGMPDELPRGIYVLAVAGSAEGRRVGATYVQYRSHLADSRDNPKLICAALWHRIHQARARDLKNGLSGEPLADDLIRTLRLDGCPSP